RSKSIGETFGRGRPPQEIRAPGQDQAKRIAEIMASIRKQRDRVGREPVNDLRNDQGEIERGRYREGSTEIRHVVGVIVVIMVIVSVRHTPLMRQHGSVIQSQPVFRAKSSRRARRWAKKAVRIRIVQSEKPPGEASGSITSSADPER